MRSYELERSDLNTRSVLFCKWVGANSRDEIMWFGMWRIRGTICNELYCHEYEDTIGMEREEMVRYEYESRGAV